MNAKVDTEFGSNIPTTNQVVGDPYGVPAAWSTPTTFDIDLPSGGKVLAKNLGMIEIIDMGLIDDLDFFQGIVGKGPEKPEKKKKVKDVNDLAAAFGGTKNFKRMLVIVDKIVMEGVIKPKIKPDPGLKADGTPVERDPRYAYVDRIPLEDRMFIFEEVFGSALGGEDFKNFREGPEQNVGDLAEEQVVELPSEPDAESATEDA